MIAHDLAIQSITIGSIVLFGTSAALALGWAMKDGQFDNFQQGSQSIFGPDEPIGDATDEFPGEGTR